MRIPARRPTLEAVRIAVWGAICALLLAPLVAMRFTEEVVWTAGDFAAATALLAIVGGAFEAIFRSPLRFRLKSALWAFILTLVALIWAYGAVAF